MNDLVEPFELPIRVEAADIDELGHVNNVVYVRWVQDAAVAHWNAVAPDSEKARLFWIVLRHEIDYRHAAHLTDRIVARTWVGTDCASSATPKSCAPMTAPYWRRPAPSGVRSMPPPGSRHR